MNSSFRSRPRPFAWIIISVILMVLMITPGGENGAREEFQADLNRNRVTEDYILDHRQITVYEGSKMIWQSPEVWEVEQILVGDVTNDGGMELVFLLWKQGSYGPSRPFWVNDKDRVWSNHLFVYSLVGDRVKQVWCSSALSPPLQGLQLATDPKTGNNFLTAREENSWAPRPIHLKWDDWGFTYVN